MGTYLTANGFEGKTQNEIISELEDEYKSIFGTDIDLDADSGFGQQIGLFSKFLIQPWDALRELYTCFDPQHATNICLDNVVAINGISRLSATATQVLDVLMEGDEGTVISAGKKVKKTNDTALFSLISAVTISKTTSAKGVISVDSVVVSNTYTVTIDSVNYDYVAQIGDDETDILDGIEALITAGAWTGTATVANEQLTLYDLIDNFNFSITGDLVVEEIWSKGDFLADDTGPIPVPATSLIEINTPVTGWNSVSNPTAGLTGRDIETDDELRLRRNQSIIKGNATDEAIRSNVFNNITGVTSVTVTSNRTESVDSESRPPHSFEAVVEGGDDTEIAQEIFDRQPAGIQSYGNTNVTITDSQGYDHEIYFSRSVAVYAYVRVKRSLYSEETYPTNGDDLIKQAIVDWSLIDSNISIGTDIITTRLIVPVYNVPGILNVEIEIDSSLTLPYTPTYGTSNISITARQKAVFATDRIEIVLLT